MRREALRLAGAVDMGDRGKARRVLGEKYTDQQHTRSSPEVQEEEEGIFMADVHQEEMGVVQSIYL